LVLYINELRCFLRLCISRYPSVSVKDNRKQKIELCRVKSDSNTDYYLKVESHSKELKERSKNELFRSRFVAGLQQIADSLTKRGGIKQEAKVHELIGRVKQKFPSIQRYLDIETEVFEKPETKRKKKLADKDNERNRIVTSVKWAVKEGIHSGWREIVRTMNTQKAVTTLAQNTREEVIMIR